MVEFHPLHREGHGTFVVVSIDKPLGNPLCRLHLEVYQKFSLTGLLNVLQNVEP